MKLTNKQKFILYGLILGDAYLQKTGKENSRLRLEHSYKQKEYIDWKFRELENIFQSKPKRIERIHPKNQSRYVYYRLQSNSSPILGKLRQIFYREKGKVIPDNIIKILKSPITLAVWYMDDGYYYKRDKSAHIYLPKCEIKDLNLLVESFKINFGIRVKYYCRSDKKGCQLNITGEDMKKFFSIISPYIIKSLRYKISFDPVTTESEN